MLSFIIEVFLSFLLFRKKTPVMLVVGISALVLIVLVVTVIRQAEYIR